MAKKERRSKWEQRFYAWLDRQPEGGIFHRICYCTAVSHFLQEEHPFWYWLLVVLMLLCVPLPMLLFVVPIEFFDSPIVSGWKSALYLIGLFSALFSSIGVANLCMPLIQRICQWRLRKDFPHGFAIPFYLGHKVTLIFLGGCGAFAALCALGIHYL